MSKLYHLLLFIIKYVLNIPVKIEVNH